MNDSCRCLLVLTVLAGACFADPKSEPATKLSEEERAILDWTNQVRQKEKLAVLKPHPLLAAAARSHSLNLAKRRDLSLPHELDGKNVEQRVLDAGYDYAEVGENLAGGDGPVPEFFPLWLKSAVHREHLFNGRYQEIGISVARDDKGKIYCTVVFGVERKKR